MGVFLLSFLLWGFAGSKKVSADIATYVVVNEAQTDSINGAGGTNDDWVELFNPTDSDVVLDGWSLQRSTSGGTIYRQTLSGTILANGYFLVVRGDADDANLISQADLLAGTSFSLSNENAIYLVDNDETIDPDLSDSNIVDYVGWGGIVYGETAAYPDDIAGGQSLYRDPEGEDSDDNTIDFELGVPSPQNSSANPSNSYSVDGEVLVTVVAGLPPYSNISPGNTDILFQVNSDGNAWVNYGLDDTYGQLSLSAIVSANSEMTISLTGLACNTTYHYQVYVENNAGDSSDQTTDAVFTTLPCGIEVNDLTMTKSQARANDEYADGWAWEIDITVWNESETWLKMMFGEWTGPASVAAGGNMQFSVNGVDWLDIEADNIYSSLGADISTIDTSLDLGRQVQILVRMKVPVGTLVGEYHANYGILTE